MLIDRFVVARRLAAIFATSTFVLAGMLLYRACPVNAQQQASSPPAATSTGQSRTSEEDHAHSDATHRYTSQADRAKDALLITEVKTALANDGVTGGHAVVVDCDHGTVLLAGAVGSSADAQHAVAVASEVDGVLAVKNQLKW
jgi:osmotically-inducible protein OsmY